MYMLVQIAAVMGEIFEHEQHFSIHTKYNFIDVKK